MSVKLRHLYMSLFIVRLGDIYKAMMAERVARTERQGMQTEFRRGNALENVHLEDRGNSCITIRYVSRKVVVSAGSVQDCLMILSNCSL
jgi:hypothetical protein